MPGELDLGNKEEIAREILAYLADHPDACDTIEGILQWWILERAIAYQTQAVKKALDKLVTAGLVLESDCHQITPYYRVNQLKISEIRERMEIMIQDNQMK